MEKLINLVKECTVTSNLVAPPTRRLDPKEYADLKKYLLAIGGKWVGGKTQAFLFNADVTPRINELLDGGKKVNLKKDYQFFATPSGLADQLVNIAISKQAWPDPSYFNYLEPSAGHGAIIKAIHKFVPGVKVDYCEIMPENQKVLKDLRYEENAPNMLYVGPDFLSLDASMVYSRIIANPPFTKNQDITHVQKMYRHLDSGGRLVSVMSTFWQTGKLKMHQQFRQWLDDLSGETIDVPRGTFKESGTEVPSVIVVIDHP